MYRVNEIFYSIQGEGIRQGTANVFIRFSGCNLQCSRFIEGFDCDTEFTSGVEMSAEDILRAVKSFPCRNIVLTGGEPALQVDQELTDTLREYYLAVETNGTYELPSRLDWVCCSPKTAEHTLRVGRVDELKYVRSVGQGIPKPKLQANHYLISPAFGEGCVFSDNLKHCIQLVKDNPRWRLSVQSHKLWGIR